MKNRLEPPDNHYVNAAEGWLELGNAAEATQEIARLSLGVLSHPDVLRVKYQLYAQTKQWERAIETARLLCEMLPEAPFGWIHLAYALHELRRTREAYSVLFPVADRFPEESIIRYNLACYSCRLGNLEEARSWIKKAVALVGSEAIKGMGLTDPDLKELQPELRRI